MHEWIDTKRDWENTLMYVVVSTILKQQRVLDL